MELTVANIIDPVFDTQELPENIRELLSNMKRFLKDNPLESYCIPAFVNGENLTIAVLRTRKNKREILVPLINPTILSNKGLIASEEKQYGVEGVYLLQRSPKVLYAGIETRELKPIQAEVVGKTALMIQQVCDALKGVSIDMLGLRIDDFPEYQKGSDEDKQEIFRGLIEELRERKKRLSNEETEAYLNATAFVAEKIERSIMIEMVKNDPRLKDKLLAGEGAKNGE